MEKIASLIANIILKQFDIEVEVKLTRPEPKFGDYATSVALQLAGRLQRPPLEIAAELVEALESTGQFSDVNVAAPGFINLTVAGDKLAEQLNSAWSDTYGHNQDGDGKTVLVEFPSPNMAKPYSVGHLRPGNQGWAAKRLMEVSGWKVITDNHLGDYGAPFGVWVVGFLKFSNQEALERDGVYELGRVYIETKQALKDEKERNVSTLADQVQTWLIKLENNDPEAVKFSQLFNEISLAHIHKVMKRLNISTDHEIGEAFYAPKGKLAAKELVKNGVAVQNDDGSIVVHLDEFGIDVPFLIQKSNGAALYATTDLATVLYREKTWQPDRVIYVVGGEQQFYFKQLFSLAKKIGIETELIHLWFGTIDQKLADGTREKMSSRKGVVLMEELLDQAEEKARAVVSSREASPDDVKKIALGAIKFSDFTADRRTNILFDWDSIFALTGFSGPYVQYAAVRVKSILGSNDAPEVDFSDYSYQPEKNIIKKLLDYPEVVRVAARELEPHKIAQYGYELAREMNRYYEATPIANGNVSEVEKAARLDLMQKVGYVFEHALNILGIEIPEKM